MRIGIVGGVARTEPQLQRVARAAGHDLEFHSGIMSSCGKASLEALVKRSDLVLITTDVNSHGAVRVARGVSRARGKSPILLRRVGPGRFAELLASLTGTRLALSS